MGLSKERGLYFQEKWEEMQYRFANIEMEKEIEEKDKEIERLNNIINELENYFNKIKDTSTLEERMIAKYMLKYIKELKGSDSNE